MQRRISRFLLIAFVVVSAAAVVKASTGEPATHPEVTMPATQFFDRPEGRIAYDDSGSGPLVVLAPSLGDVRAEYRFLAPQLIAAGYRVVRMDLRGLGESSTGWAEYTGSAIGADILALVKHLNAGPATVIGCSMAGGAAVWAAAEAPELVTRLVLVDPFVRTLPPALPMQSTLLRIMFARPWGPSAWGSYYASLYPTRQPVDFAEYKKALVANLAAPGRMEATQGMLRASKADTEQRLTQVRAATLVVMGSKDPDFKNVGQEKEAREVAEILHGRHLMVESAGHYPHAEMPEVTGPAIIAFLSEARGS